MRALGRLTTIAAVLGGIQEGHSQESKPLRPQVVSVYPWRPDTALLRAEHSRIIVYVRDVTAPGRGWVGARVFLTNDGIVPAGYATSVAVTDSTGMAELRSVPSRTRYILIRSIAYDSALIPLSAVPGCTVYVEAYLRMIPFCTANCPETPSRATVTTCRSDR